MTPSANIGAAAGATAARVSDEDKKKNKKYSIQTYQRKSENKRLALIFSTIILVSGLLTTSTYPAFYQSNPGQMLDLRSTNVTVGEPVVSNNPALEFGFRLCNGLSFLFSLMAICISVSGLYALSYFSVFEGNTEAEELRFMQRERLLTSNANLAIEMWSHWAAWCMGLSFASAYAGCVLFALRFLGYTSFAAITIAFVCVAIIVGLGWWRWRARLSTKRSLKFRPWIHKPAPSPAASAGSPHDEEAGRGELQPV